MAEIKEFKVSELNDPIQFKIGDDVFVGLPANKVPAGALIRYAELVNDGKVFAAHTIFFNDILEDESAAKFSERIDSKENPINLSTMVEVATWLMEQCSHVPTGPAKR